MDEIENVSLHVAEYIKDRLYFATLQSPDLKPCSTKRTHFFSIDSELLYKKFRSDFGPLNLGKLCHYCCKLNSKLKCAILRKRKIVHCTSSDPKKRVNAAFLIGSFAIIYLKKTPAEAYQSLVSNDSPMFIPFRDVSNIECTYKLTLAHCLLAVSKAVETGLLDLEKFNVEEYEHYEKSANGDLTWIVPNKLLAMCGPRAERNYEDEYVTKSPEFYIPYFRKQNVTTIVRLNKEDYNAQIFTDHGFIHKDLIFDDGRAPSDKVMEDFLEIAENAQGAIAVHCKAGLGRTGTMIACYIMKHHHFTAAEAIAWIRICRPGSIIGPQQHWLDGKQGLLLYQGFVFRSEKANCKKKKFSLKRIMRNACRKRADTDVSQILSKVEQIQLDEKLLSKVKSFKEKAVQNGNYFRNNNDNINDNSIESEDTATQGDELNRIKAMRCQPRSHTTAGTSSAAHHQSDDANSAAVDLFHQSNDANSAAIDLFHQSDDANSAAIDLFHQSDDPTNKLQPVAHPPKDGTHHGKRSGRKAESEGSPDEWIDFTIFFQESVKNESVEPR